MFHRHTHWLSLLLFRVICLSQVEVGDGAAEGHRGTWVEKEALPLDGCVAAIAASAVSHGVPERGRKVSHE